MEIIQDGITYTIFNGIIKGWFGTSPFTKPFYDGNIIIESWTDEDEEDKISEAKDTKLKEMQVLAKIELSELQGRIESNDILRTVGRNEKNIPNKSKAWASSVLDQQETIEEEIQELETYQEVIDYEIIFE